MATKVKRFAIDVLVVPPRYEIELGIADVRTERRVVYATSRAEAMAMVERGDA